jgi:hypothetical protein
VGYRQGSWQNRGRDLEECRVVRYMTNQGSYGNPRSADMLGVREVQVPSNDSKRGDDNPAATCQAEHFDRLELERRERVHDHISLPLQMIRSP